MGMALLLIILGKFFMAGASYQALRNYFSPATLRFSFYAYNITQLPKYVPGSVWHHIGRAYIYGEYGIPRLLSLKIIVFENFWLVVTSIGLGSMIVFLGNVSGYSHVLWPKAQLAGSVLVSLLLLLTVVITVLAFLFRYSVISVSSLRKIARPDPVMISSLISVWVLLGMSMYVLLSQGEFSFGALTYTVGIFALGYGAGLAVPIAPAGLGVRESVMIAGFLHIAPTLELGVIFAVHRLLYLIVDLTFAIVAYSLAPNPCPVSQPSI